MNYSEIHEDIKLRYLRKKWDKVVKWLWICFIAAAITTVFWSFLMQWVYPRQALPQVQAMTWKKEQALYWQTLAMMAEASSTNK